MASIEKQDNNYIKFLGTAGARFVMARQLRYSAGTYIRIGGVSIILDPGPGTLLRCAKSRPPIDVSALDAIILTHVHLDHSSDVNVLIDAMTGGGIKKRGSLFAPKECLEGENRIVLSYLRGFLDRIQVLDACRDYTAEGVRFSTSIRHQHGVETYGIQFEVNGEKISFMSDTKFFPELTHSYRDSRILVMNVVRRASGEFGDIPHLTLDDARTIISAVRPEIAVITHLGMTMIRENPRTLSLRLSKELGTKVIVATDGLTVPI